jgi:hypothetical protein
MTMVDENITGWQSGGHGIFGDIIPGFRMEKQKSTRYKNFLRIKRNLTETAQWKIKKNCGEGLNFFI